MRKIKKIQAAILKQIAQTGRQIPTEKLDNVYNGIISSP